MKYEMTIQFSDEDFEKVEYTDDFIKVLGAAQIYAYIPTCIYIHVYDTERGEIVIDWFRD